MLATTAINAAIRRARLDGKTIEINDPSEPGLNIRIGQKSVTWTWMGRDSHGRVRRFRLGRYPHVGIAQARRRARTMADEVRRGADPVAEARARRAAQKAPGHTLSGLLDLYGRQVGAAKKSWPVMEAQARHIFRPHLDTPLSGLSLGAMQLTVDQYVRPKAAAFGLNCLRPVLRWAAAPGRGYVDRSLLDLASSAPKSERDRTLSREELGALLPVLREHGPHDVFADALRFILLTATRRNEVASARWRDIDFLAAAWRLPMTKNGESHTVPLSRQAVALLRARAGGEPDPAALIFTTGAGGKLTAWGVPTARAQAASGTGGWTRHDLRRTAATMMGELGVLPSVVEAALNHSTIHSQIASVYNKSRYRPQVADALQQLADRLDAIEHGGAEIVALRAG
jgi:integrase